MGTNTLMLNGQKVLPDRNLEYSIAQFATKTKSVNILSGIRALPLKYFNALPAGQYVFQCENAYDLTLLRRHFKSKLPFLENYYIEYTGLGEINDFTLKTLVYYFAPERDPGFECYTSLFSENQGWRDIFKITNFPFQMFVQNHGFLPRFAKTFVAIMDPVDCDICTPDFPSNCMLLGGSDDEIADTMSRAKNCRFFLASQPISAYRGSNTLWSAVSESNPFMMLRNIRTFTYGLDQVAVYWFERA